FAGFAGPGGAPGSGAAPGRSRPPGAGGPPGAGAPAGPGGGFAGFGGPPAEPVTLSRNGRQFEYTGQTTIRSGAEVRVDTARESVSLTLSEMDHGSWVIFELPGFKTAASGKKQRSLDALHKADESSYYKSGDT